MDEYTETYEADVNKQIMEWWKIKFPLADTESIQDNPEILKTIALRYWKEYHQTP